MAITFDNSGGADQFRSSQSSVSWGHTLGSGSSRIVIAGCGGVGNAAMTITGMTFNGVAMTSIDTSIDLTGGARPMGWFYLPEASLPATGTYTVTATFSTNVIDVIRGCSLSYTGVSQNGIPAVKNANFTASSVTSLTTNVTVPSSNNWLVGFNEAQAIYSSITGGVKRVSSYPTDRDGQFNAYDSNGVVGTGTQGMTIGLNVSSYVGFFVMSIEPLGDLSPRYWVGGTGTWDSSTTTHWSLTSGGSGGASVPVLGTTDIFFDANSGGGTITTSGTLNLAIGNLVATGFTGTLTIASALTVANCTLGTGMTLNGTSSLSCRDFISGASTTIAGTFTLNCLGNFTLTSGSTYTYTGAITFSAVTSMTITTATKTIGSVVVFNGVAGTWTLQDNFLCTGASITLTNGSLLLNNFNLTTPTFVSANANTRVLTLGTGTVTLTDSGTVWNTSTTTGLTFTSTGSTIKLTDATSTGKTFSGGGLTFNNLWLTGAGTGAYTIVGNNTFNDFKCDTPPHTVNFTAGSTTKVLTFTVNGTAGNLMTLQSTSSGSAWNIVKNTGGGVISCDYLSLQDSHATAL